jgi:hypothetical protein
MALSNESYIVQTTTGEVIVPVATTVPYLNINLIGYSHFSYHSVMSQNLANIVDDIKAMQDGGLSAVTFDLDALIATAQAEIDSRINLFNDAIFAKIVQLTDEALTTTVDSLEAFRIQLEGVDGNGGIVADTVALVDIIGDSNTGMVKQIDVLEDAVGITGTGGLLQQFTGISDIVTQTATELAAAQDDIIDQQVITSAAGTGLVPRLAEVQTIIGDVGSGLVKDNKLNKDMIFGDGTYEGLLSLVGDNVSGLTFFAQTTRTSLNAQIAFVNPKVNYLEQRLGNLDINNDSGLIGDVKVLTGLHNTLSDIVGLNDTLGLQLRLTTIENLNPQSIYDSIYASGNGLIDYTIQLRADIDALEASATASSASSNQTVIDLTAVVNSNIVRISATEAIDVVQDSKISTLETDVDTVELAIANISSTIVDDTLTYVGATTTVFTPTVLYDMKIETDKAFANDIMDRFVTYFGTSATGVTASEVGDLNLQAWIADASTTGFKLLTDGHIATYLATNWPMTQINLNKDALLLLNGNIGTAGSVSHTVKTAVDVLDNTLNNATTGSITIINGDDTVEGSTDKKILDYDTSLQIGSIANLQTQIDNVATANTDSNEALAQQTEELQVEMVRYDTILPFLQKMFKYVNNPGSLTDADIDTVFSTVIDKVQVLAGTINNIDYVIYLNVPNSTFDISLKLDSDLKFSNLDPNGSAGPIGEIIRVADGMGAPIELNDITVGYDQGIYTDQIASKVFVDENDLIGEDVLDLLGDNATIVLKFGTTDIFGQHKVNEVKLT